MHFRRKKWVDVVTSTTSKQLCIWQKPFNMLKYNVYEIESIKLWNLNMNQLISQAWLIMHILTFCVSSFWSNLISSLCILKIDDSIVSRRFSNIKWRNINLSRSVEYLNKENHSLYIFLKSEIKGKYWFLMARKLRFL